MKKALFTLIMVLLAVAAHAQLKIRSNGHVSLGCLTTTYGAQVKPNGYVYFKPKYDSSYTWGEGAISREAHQKQWVVLNDYDQDSLNKHMFYVYGYGGVHAAAYYTFNTPPNNSHRDAPESINGEDALSSILGLQGFYFTEDMPSQEDIENSEFVQEDAKTGMINDIEKRSIGFMAENVEEVIPDAVRTDPEARLCINYQSIVTILTEAVKQQQQEIQLLRKTLEENGLLEPEKR